MKTLDDLIALHKLFPYNKNIYISPVAWILKAVDLGIVKDSEFDCACLIVRQHLYAFQ